MAFGRRGPNGAETAPAQRHKAADGTSRSLTYSHTYSGMLLTYTNIVESRGRIRESRPSSTCAQGQGPLRVTIIIIIASPPNELLLFFTTNSRYYYLFVLLDHSIVVVVVVKFVVGWELFIWGQEL